MKKFKHLIDELHNLICQADENNRAFVIEKLSDQTINQINAFAKQNDFYGNFSVERDGYFAVQTRQFERRNLEGKI